MHQYAVMKIFYVELAALQFNEAALPLLYLRCTVFISHHLCRPFLIRLISRRAIASWLAICSFQMQVLFIAPAMVVYAYIERHTNRTNKVPFPFSELIVYCLIGAEFFAKLLSIYSPTFSKAGVVK